MSITPNRDSNGNKWLFVNATEENKEPNKVVINLINISSIQRGDWLKNFCVSMNNGKEIIVHENYNEFLKELFLKE